MKEERFATLPSVLTEYGHVPKDQQIRPKSSGCTEEEEEENAENQNLNIEQQDKSSKKKSQKQRKSPQLRSHSGHERPAAKRAWGRKGSEAERLEWVADTWDQARAEILHERHEILNRKLVLQHALVKAQDRRAQLRRHLENEAELKKREEEKKLRKDKIESLESHCKQSLNSDRKSKRKPRSTSESDDQNSHDADAQSTETGSTSVGRRDRIKGHTGYMPSDAYRPASQGMQEVMNEEEEEEEAPAPAADGVVTPADLSEVPWHHAQLYKMYGRNADYYIHPKMQVEKKKVVHPTLKRQKGHLGAGHIWTTLRSDSTNKLLRTDRRFPTELKEAFGSHVRDGITKHKKPVFRNFTETEDVPDLPRLLDQSLLRRIRVLRHKTELMYRSSQTNHDRTKILLFNSPLPEPSEGDQGIGKYLPSWDNDMLSDTSEASYMKWLKKDALQRSNQDLTGSLNEDDVKALGGEGEVEAQEGGAGEKGEEPQQDGHELAPPPRRMWHPQSVLSPLGSEMNESLHDIWHKVMTRHRPRKDTRYHFLTEAEARTKGEFLAKLGLEPDKIDCGRTDLLPSLDQAGHGRNQPGRQSLPHSIKAMSAPRGDRGLRYSLSGPGQMRSESAQHPSPGAYETRWQPLSMQALIEYKDQLGADGTGEFSQGRQPMWRTKEAAAAAEG